MAVCVWGGGYLRGSGGECVGYGRLETGGEWSNLAEKYLK